MKTAKCDYPNVIIPAAGDGTRLQDIAFSKPKPLISLCGKPIIAWIVQKLVSEHCHDILFVVPNAPNCDPIALFVKDVYAGVLRARFVPQKRKLGPLHAIHLALNEVTSKGVLIVLSDTICFDQLSGFGFEHSWVLASPVQDHEPWCLVETTHDGSIHRLYDKPSTAPPTNRALVGIYYFHDAAAFHTATARVIRRCLKRRNEYQISSAIEEYMKYTPVRVFTATHWHDVGSIENLRRATDKLMTTRSRAFNRLDLSVRTGIITKVAEGDFGTSTLRDEIHYYARLPRGSEEYFPRVVDSSISKRDVKLTVEYWPLDNLADTFVFSRYSAALWGDVVISIATLLDIFRRAGASRSVSLDTRRMLWDKTLSRVDDLVRAGFQLANADELVVNGRLLRGWPSLSEGVRHLLTNLSRRSEPAAVHGDLCFSNILGDVRTGLIKCVDPRGRFGLHFGVLGDQRYDLAKLRHSYHGYYDLIVNNLYTLAKPGPARFNFKVLGRAYHREIAEIFDRQLIVARQIKLMDIEIIEGLLFISMCPLHYEDPQRQVALWIRGLQILNDCVEAVL